MNKPDFTLSLLKIPVSNVEKSAQFYVEGLGFSQQFVAAAYGWAQFLAGDVPLGLYEPGKGGGTRQPGGSVDFHLSTTALVDLEARLKQYGANIYEGIVQSNDGLDILEVEDPDGNVLKFVQQQEEKRV